MSKTNEFEIHKVCRTCLSSGILKPLYDNYSTQECFGQMLMVCTEVQCDESDGLPRQICNKCIIELNRCYKFALKCRQSDNTLRSYIEKLIPEQYGQEYNADADPLDISVLHKELDLETFMIKQETDIDASSEADQFRTDSYQPEQANISNSTMATTMSSLLLQWGLPNLVADFEEQEIDESCLCDLSEELIKELIPKIGPRTRFMKHHKSYQSQLSNKPNVVAPALNPRYNTVLEIPKDSAAVNMIVPTTPQESSCSEPREFKRMCREINHFDIKAFLLTSSAGKFILNEYDAKKQLSRKSRNLLVDSLINGLMSDSDNKFLNNDDFRILGEKICELFSTEVLSTYYFPLVSCKMDPQGKSPTAKGKLVDKYRNVCRYYSNSLSGSNEEDSNTLPISEDNTVTTTDTDVNLIAYEPVAETSVDVPEKFALVKICSIEKLVTQQKRLLMLSEQQTKTQKLIWNEMKIINSLERLPLVHNENEYLKTINSLMPLSTLDNLKILETHLEADQPKNEFSKLIANVGGDDAKDCTQRILKRVYENSLAVQCSWIGLRNNFGISKLKNTQLIKECIMVTYSYEIQEKRFEKIVSEWFRLAKTRLARKNQI